MRHNVWTLAIGNNDPITPEQALKDLQNAQIDKKTTTIEIVISKRDSQDHIRTNIGERWASFDQMRMIKLRVLDSDPNTQLYSDMKKKLLKS